MRNILLITNGVYSGLLRDICMVIDIPAKVAHHYTPKEIVNFIERTSTCSQSTPVEKWCRLT